MTFREFLNAPRMRPALAVLASSVAVVGWSFSHAMKPPLPPAPTSPANAPMVAALQLPPEADPVDPDAVAASDVFSQNRKPGRNRYRLPNEKDPTAVAPAAARTPPRPVVVGVTRFLGDSTHNFAVVTLQNQTLQHMAVGNTIGRGPSLYTLVWIGAKAVKFVAAAGDTVLVSANK